MGLSVKIYNNLVLTDDQENATFQVFNYDDFKDRAKSLVQYGYYAADKVGHFISYPSTVHNEVRDQLCKVTNTGYDWAHETVHPDTPFFELLEFADNEGVMDAETCEALYNDFVEWKDKAKEVLPERYMEYYDEWLKTFELGKNNGAIVFG